MSASKRDVLRLAAETDLDVRTAGRALEFGAASLKKHTDRERVVAAALKLGLTLPPSGPLDPSDAKNRLRVLVAKVGGFEQAAALFPSSEAGVALTALQVQKVCTTGLGLFRGPLARVRTGIDAAEAAAAALENAAAAAEPK